VDLAPAPNGEISWAWPLYHELASYMKDAAFKLDQLIEWGGDWRTFRDGPHWQLPWATYP
jgi:peptidoglycan L-alanyl-D-glutamate endopeptidase CwlK